ncbi:MULTISPECIES: pentapeptide repeat-containing protein [Streptomyces]|uniref:Pentapeptide repeat-containing protein n=1 Tax=Streptomyces solicathayae TaxID=3081768 RepID=A0ABZ0M3H6_9ACTN|nr:pentapeptide repeat-containing protein [Streptomyces sp. HUAS YS2]WOX26332.1 pentapeptide repeat-containing protein [Streptomyces sp. HUAS YS2]
MLPGLAALVALVFTWLSVGQTNKDLQISEQGQITNRFNAAITNLGSASLDVRLGGVYALQRIMQDSPRDQPTVVSVLSAFVRQHASVPVSGFRPAGEYRPATDVAAVVSVLGDRPAGREVSQDGKPLYRVDLSGADLGGLEREVGLTEGGVPRRVNFRFADFTGADLRDAGLENFDLSGASLDHANMAGVKLPNADLRRAFLGGANLTDALLGAADLTGADLDGANLHNAHLSRAEEASETSAADSSADLTGAHLIGADLSAADLRGVLLIGADLTGADLAGADLRGANLTGADLSNADLTGAKLAGAELSGAILRGARGVPPGSSGGSP